MLLNPYRFGVPVFKAEAVVFDGTNDFMRRVGPLTGGTLSTQFGLFSMWLRIDGGDGVNRYLLAGLPSLASSTIDWGIRLTSVNRLQINLPGGQVRSLTALTTGATWRHFLASWSNTTASPACHIYLTDVNDVTAGDLSNLNNAVVDYDCGDWSVGATGSGTQKWPGALADVYFTNTYMDLSVQANRRNFISATGKPVFLGSNGSLPTGAVPLIYHHIDLGEPPDNFALNRGSGGNFTVTGALTASLTSPSD